MRIPAQSLLPLLGETDCGYPYNTAEQERVLALSVLRLALAQVCADSPALGSHWEVVVLQVKKDWYWAWHPLRYRQALCRVRLSPCLPLTELIFCYAYPEGYSVEELECGCARGRWPGYLSNSW